MKHPKLSAIPPANRQRGNLARVARYGKGQPTTRVGQPRAAATQGASTSFQPRIVTPDPRIREVREAYRAALQQRRADVEKLIREAALPEEANVWQGILQRLERQ